MLRDDKASVGELLDIRNGVVLGHVDSEHCASYEGEATPDQTHFGLRILSSEK